MLYNSFIYYKDIILAGFFLLDRIWFQVLPSDSSHLDSQEIPTRSPLLTPITNKSLLRLVVQQLDYGTDVLDASNGIDGDIGSFGSAFGFLRWVCFIAESLFFSSNAVLCF